MEDVGIFYSRLVYLTAIWYFLWSFGIFYAHLVYFSRFGMLHQEKSGNPGFGRNFASSVLLSQPIVVR
jgi:hypothetical protein